MPGCVGHVESGRSILKAFVEMSELDNTALIRYEARNILTPAFWGKWYQWGVFHASKIDCGDFKLFDRNAILLKEIRYYKLISKGLFRA